MLAVEGACALRAQCRSVTQATSRLHYKQCASQVFCQQRSYQQRPLCVQGRQASQTRRIEHKPCVPYWQDILLTFISHTFHSVRMAIGDLSAVMAPPGTVREQGFWRNDQYLQCGCVTLIRRGKPSQHDSGAFADAVPHGVHTVLA